MTRRRTDREQEARQLRRLLQQADFAVGFVAGRDRNDLDTDPQLLFAVVKAVENVAEAAGMLSDQTRDLAPEVPWTDLIGMRIRLAHRYWDIDHDIVWDAAAVHLPRDVVALRRLLHLIETGADEGGPDGEDEP